MSTIEYRPEFSLAIKTAFGLTLYHLGILANNDGQEKKFDKTEIVDELRNFISEKYKGFRICSIVSLSLGGKINYDQIKRDADKYAKEFYYSKFNLPYILEIPASELQLEADVIQKIKEKTTSYAISCLELSPYIKKYLDDKYDFCYKNYTISPIINNKYKEFSSVVIEIEWDVSE